MTTHPLPADFMLPTLTPFNREWFTSATLAVQRCTTCAHLQHPPEEICRSCAATDFDVQVVAPRGIVHSHTVVHYAAADALATSVPYVVVLVSLDDVPELRVVGNLVDADPADARIGLAVTAVWTDHDAGDGVVIRLPNWRPSG